MSKLSLNSKNNQPQGFLIISLIISLSVIAILGFLYFAQSGNQKSSRATTGKKAIEQTEQNNQLLKGQGAEIQQNLQN